MGRNIIVIIQNNYNVLNTNHNLGQPYPVEVPSWNFKKDLVPLLCICLHVHNILAFDRYDTLYTQNVKTKFGPQCGLLLFQSQEHQVNKPGFATQQVLHYHARPSWWGNQLILHSQCFLHGLFSWQENMMAEMLIIQLKGLKWSMKYIKNVTQLKNWK